MKPREASKHRHRCASCKAGHGTAEQRPCPTCGKAYCEACKRAERIHKRLAPLMTALGSDK